MTLDINYVARNVSIPESFREYAEERFDRIQPLTNGAQRLEIKLTKQAHRGADGSMTVELTLHEKSDIIRAESSDNDKLVAFDQTFQRLQERLRRLRDRRKGGRRRASVSEATASLTPPTNGESLVNQVLEARRAEEAEAEEAERARREGAVPVSIRQKVFPTERMSVDEAVDNMELVGHDFYLFVDSETDRPSVAYRRRGWSYGVIALGDEESSTERIYHSSNNGG